MLRKLLSKSGRRLLRAIKKLSTRSRKAKRSQNLTPWHSAIPDLESSSFSWSMPSLDTRSIDTFMTFVNSEDCISTCCYCHEHEQNQKNENIENEMII